jgi:hypothetical protein
MSKYAGLVLTFVSLAACTSTMPTPEATPGSPVSASKAPAANSDLTLHVDSKSVPCEGANPQTCLRVRRGDSAEWELFYDSIEGFEPKPGHAYELIVRLHPVEDPPADASSIRYELIRVVREIVVTVQPG